MLSDAGSEALVSFLVGEKNLCFFVVEDLVQEYLQVSLLIDDHVAVSNAILQHDVVLAVADHVEEPLRLVLFFVAIHDVEPQGDIVSGVLAFVQDSFLRNVGSISISDWLHNAVTKHEVGDTLSNVRPGHHDFDIEGDGLMESKTLTVPHILIMHFIHLPVLTVGLIIGVIDGLHLNHLHRQVVVHLHIHEPTVDLLHLQSSMSLSELFMGGIFMIATATFV